MKDQSEARPSPQHDIIPDTIELNLWRELSAMALICLEMSWVILWFEFLRPGDPPDPMGSGYFGFVLNMAFAYTLARSMFLVKLRSSVRRYVLLGAYVFATILFIRELLGPIALLESNLITSQDLAEPVPLAAVLILAILSAFIWFRGVSLAYSWLDARVALRSFRFGVGMLILLGLINVLFKVPQPYQGLGAFAVSGLLALTAARAASLGRLRGGLPVSFTRSWILGMLVSTAAVVWFSLLFGNIVAGDVARWTAGVFLLVVRVLFILGFLVVSPVLLLVLISWPWFQGQAESSPVLQGIGRELNRLVQLLTQLLVDFSRFMQGFFESAPDIRSLKPWLIGGAAAATLGILFVWFGRRWRLPWRREANLEEEAILLDRGDLRARLALALREGLSVLGERLRQVRLTPGLLGALRIRVLYARLMGLCAGLGAPRGDTLTPLEFLTTLDNLFPRAREEARTMTQAYNRVRYGEIPESRAEVEAVEAAWQRLRAEGKGLRQVRKQLDPAGEGRPRT
jgi:hypothetical protein